MSQAPNTPDDPTSSHRHGSDFSSLESGYWQMLIHREARCHVDSEKDAFERREIESLFKTWNERFGTDVRPRWLDDMFVAQKRDALHEFIANEDNSMNDRLQALADLMYSIGSQDWTLDEEGIENFLCEANQ